MVVLPLPLYLRSFTTTLSGLFLSSTPASYLGLDADVQSVLRQPRLLFNVRGDLPEGPGRVHLEDHVAVVRLTFAREARLDVDGKRRRRSGRGGFSVACPFVRYSRSATAAGPAPPLLAPVDTDGCAWRCAWRNEACCLLGVFISFYV